MANDRQMIVPYTLTAKIVRFPFKFYYNNSRFKYILWSIAISFPIFYKIQKLSYSDANMIKYQKYLRKEREEVEEHKKHLL